MKSIPIIDMLIILIMRFSGIRVLPALPALCGGEINLINPLRGWFLSRLQFASDGFQQKRQGIRDLG
jgi:hypothetical protein